MTTLCASPALLANHQQKQKGGIAAFIGTVYPPRLEKRRQKKGRSLVPQVPLPAELREPTPERAAKSMDIRRSEVPPFNSQILSAYQKFHKQLGGDVLMVLDEFYDLAQRANSVPRMSAKYDGITVDQSRTAFSHVTEAQRASMEDFHRIWGGMGPNYQRLITELLFEQPIAGERARSYPEIGRELCGYAQDQPCRATVVGALRLIAWRIQELMGGKVPVRRMAGA
jgi:hypothetical protein